MDSQSQRLGNRFCPECGHQHGNARFCPSCGAKLHTEATQPTSVQPPNPESQPRTSGIWANTASVVPARDSNVVGLRIAAALLDAFGILVLAFILIVSSGDNANSTALIGWWVILGFVNFVVLQGLTGQSAGKMVLGLKIVSEDGISAPGVNAAFLRWFMYLFEGVLGLLVILLSSKNQRLGDMLAGTLVVRD